MDSKYSRLESSPLTPDGFTLIELLIVLLIMSILLAYPLLGIQQHLNRTHRLDAQMALLDLANRMERYHIKYHTYQHASIASGNKSDIVSTPYSSDGWYVLSIRQATETGYLLQASLSMEHVKTDPSCPMLTLSSRGEINSFAPHDCWS